MKLKDGFRKRVEALGYRKALLIGFLYNMAASLYNSLLTLLALDAGGGAELVAVSTSTVNLGFLLSSPYGGSIGDRIGRKTPLLAGFLALLVSSILLVLAYRGRVLPLFPISGLFAGVASGLVSPNISMLVVELGVPREKRPEKPLSRLGVWSSLGWSLGLVIGAIISNFLPTMCTALIISLSSAVGVLATLALPRPLLTLERETIAKPTSLFHGVVERVKLVYVIVTHPPILVQKLFSREWTRFTLYNLAIVACFIGAGLFFTQMPTYLKQVRGLSDSLILVALAVHSISSTIIFTSIYTIATLIGTKKLLLLGIGGRVIVFLAPLTTEYMPAEIQALITYTFTGATWALISVSTNSLAVYLAGIKSGGKSIGILNSSMGIGLIIGSLASGIIAKLYGLRTCFIAASSFMLASLLMLYKALKGVKI